MSHDTHRSPASSTALLFGVLAAVAAVPACAATPPDQSQPAKPMMKNEPMAGEMKKDGMMKEDVSKAAKAWSGRMDEKMKQEKMK